MKKLLVDAGTLGNAKSRAMTYQPRIDGMSIYPDSDSAWVTLFAIKNTSFEADGTMGLGARVLYCFNADGVTPAMAVTEPVAGSDYAVGYLDADKPPMDGGKSYKRTLPKDVPVNNFWAETIYHAQTRSQLQTSQKVPTVRNLTTGMKKNANGVYDIYFGPKAPEGMEENWLDTKPGQTWFTILQMYGPLEPWPNKSWHPSEIELIK